MAFSVTLALVCNCVCVKMLPATRESCADAAWPHEQSRSR